MSQDVLTPENLFRILCRESYEDGRLDEDEATLLSEIRTLLRLGPEQATEILKQARENPGTSGRRFDPVEAFRSCCRLAWADGKLEPKERSLALGLAEFLQLERETALSLLSEAGLEQAGLS